MRKVELSGLTGIHFYVHFARDYEAKYPKAVKPLGADVPLLTNLTFLWLTGSIFGRPTRLSPPSPR